MTQDMTQSATPPPLPPDTAQEVYCFACGQKILAMAQICPHCGVSQRPAVVQSGSRGALIAVIIVAAVMVVFFIVGILAAIAIPNFISYRNRAYDAAANADAKNCYVAAQAYFQDYPDGEVNLDQVKAYGFVQSPMVTVEVEGNARTLSIAAMHMQGKTIYHVDAGGNIVKEGAD